MKYYIDSSENPSSQPEDAIDGPFLDLANAQEMAIALAEERPGTIFYVNAVEVIIKQVYKAEGVVEMKTEVMNGDPE